MRETVVFLAFTALLGKARGGTYVPPEGEKFEVSPPYPKSSKRAFVNNFTSGSVDLVDWLGFSAEPLGVSPTLGICPNRPANPNLEHNEVG